MSDNVITNPGTGGAQFRSLDDGTNQWPACAISYATTVSPGANVLNVVSPSNRLPVDVGTVAVTGTFWQATQPVSGTVSVSNFPATQPVSIASSVAVTGTFWQATQPVSAASLPLPSNAAQETGGNLATLVTRTPAQGQTTMSASSPVVIASDQSTLPVNQAGVSATGSITALNANLASGVATANSAVALSLSGMTGFAVDLRGTFTATIVIQGSVDGSNWITLSVLPVGAGLNIAQVASATAAGAWWGNANGFQQVRATASAYTSGTVTVVLRAMQAAGMVLTLPAGQTTQAVSGTVTANVAASTNAIGDVGVQYRASATGGASPLSVLSPATPAATAIKAGAGRLVGAVLVNSAATVRSVKFWNTAVAGVTMGTTAALFEWDIPPGGFLQFQLPGGIGFATAITYAVTGAKGLTDNTAITLNDVSGAFFFA